MHASARAVPFLILSAIPATCLAQAGPSDPQVIAGASTAKISVGSRKLAGHVVATVRVGVDGRVKEVLVTENTAEPAFEPQIVKVLESARFRPAIDASGKLVEGNAELKVELRQSTGAEPKPVATKLGPEATEPEKERIMRMRCVDFVWEWDLIREESSSVATEFMPRIATTTYVNLRQEEGVYVDSKAWKASAKALRESADRCRDNPQALFFQGTFKPIMDEAVAD
jgi:hypothetical protein